MAKPDSWLRHFDVDAFGIVQNLLTRLIHTPDPENPKETNRNLIRAIMALFISRAQQRAAQTHSENAEALKNLILGLNLQNPARPRKRDLS